LTRAKLISVIVVIITKVDIWILNMIYMMKNYSPINGGIKCRWVNICTSLHSIYDRVMHISFFMCSASSFYLKLFFFLIVFCYLNSDDNGVSSWSSGTVDQRRSWREGEWLFIYHITLSLYVWIVFYLNLFLMRRGTKGPKLNFIFPKEKIMFKIIGIKILIWFS
jgi:hypothetical protein